MRKIFSFLMAIVMIAMAAIACQSKSDYERINELVVRDSSGDEDFYSWLTEVDDIYDATLEGQTNNFIYSNKDYVYGAFINRYNVGDYDMAMYIAAEIKSRENSKFDQVKAELMIRDAELQNLYYQKDIYGNLKGLDNDYFVNMDRLLSIIYGIGKENIDIVESDNYMSGLYDVAKRYIDNRDNLVG